MVENINFNQSDIYMSIDERFNVIEKYKRSEIKCNFNNKTKWYGMLLNQECYLII